MKAATSKLLLVGALLAGIMLKTSPVTAQVFREDFNGTEIDTTLWAVEPGDGEVIVADGVVTLSCSGSTFPVVTSRLDPFPEGDFRVRVGMQYLSVARCGDGFGAMDNFWENYHGAPVCRPFLLWQDGGGLYVYTGSVGNTGLAGPPQTDYHVYEWSYINGAYSFSMDEVTRATGACAPRATSIFFGHPHPIGCSPWTSFAIDFIEVTAEGATPTGRTSWGRLKRGYR